MYIPKDFQEKNEDEIIEFIEHNSFGMLISYDGNRPLATQTPFLIEKKGDDLILIGHISKGNPQWKSLDQQEVLVAFTGPHSYVSASWYEEEESVSTWNYMTAQVNGICHTTHEQEELLTILQKTADFYEKPLQHAWKIEENMGKVNQLINGIVGFHIEITKLEAASKLSQDHPKHHQEKVIQALEKSYHHYDGKEIAKNMKEKLDI